VRHIGVDLAWGDNARTGLCAVDENGTVLGISTVRTDDEILGWMQACAPDSCLVAIDAPLVVENDTGQRACEALVARHFGRFQAYCHSSNTSKPYLAHGGRARRLADRLELDIDPASKASRRAIEVYPHTAIVQLFGLDRIIRYKNKPNRSMDSLRAEMTRLADHLEGLDSAVPRLALHASAAWREIRSQVDTSARKSEIARVEDAVDACICAYTAVLADREPARVRVLGDLATGYILTPVTPEMAAEIDDGRSPPGTASGQALGADVVRTERRMSDETETANDLLFEPPEHEPDTWAEDGGSLPPGLTLTTLLDVEVRRVWPSEAIDFTPWLLKSAGVLSDLLGVDLELTAREHPVGRFSLDLIGHETNSDAVVIVENQYGSTDHNHLGQLLTYAGGTKPATIIWLAEDFREEHRAALDWLNSSTIEEIRFFGVRLRAVTLKDGDRTLVAPHLELIAKPNAWEKAVRTAVSDSVSNSRNDLYREFWAEVEGDLRRKGWTNGRAPAQNWWSLPTGTSGATWGISFATFGCRSELFFGDVNAGVNLARYRALEAHRQDIERGFGEALIYDELPSAKGCRIETRLVGPKITDKAEWPSVRSWMLDTQERLRACIAATGGIPVVDPATNFDF